MDASPSPSPARGEGRGGDHRGGGESGVRSLATQRLKSCRSTSFIGWLSGEGGGSLCGGADGASGVGEFGGTPRPWWPPWPNPCCRRLPKVSPSLPSASDCPLSPEPDPPDPPSPPKPPPLPNRPLPISLSLA